MLELKITYFCKSKIKPFKILIMAYVISEDCIVACGSCIDECPVDAISEGDIYAIDPELCTDCGACADVCPMQSTCINKWAGS